MNVKKILYWLLVAPMIAVSIGLALFAFKSIVSAINEPEITLAERKVWEHQARLTDQFEHGQDIYYVLILSDPQMEKFQQAGAGVLISFTLIVGMWTTFYAIRHFYLSRREVIVQNNVMIGELAVVIGAIHPEWEPERLAAEVAKAIKMARANGLLPPS